MKVIHKVSLNFVFSFFMVSGMDQEPIGRIVSLSEKADYNDLFLKALIAIDRHDKKEFKQLLSEKPFLIDDQNTGCLGSLLHVAINICFPYAVKTILELDDDRILNTVNNAGSSSFEAALILYKYGINNSNRSRIMQLFAPKISKKMVREFILKPIDEYSIGAIDVLLDWLNSDKFNLQCSDVTEIRQKDQPKAKTVLLSFKMLAKKWGIQIGPKYIRNNILCMALQQESEILQLRESKPNRKLEISDF